MNKSDVGKHGWGKDDEGGVSACGCGLERMRLGERHYMYQRPGESPTNMKSKCPVGYPQLVRRGIL